MNWIIWGKLTMKNTAAIDKIIAELAHRDYRAYNPVLPNGRLKYNKYHPYTLSPETNEAREVKSGYLNGRITEEQYKAYCLRYNLTH